ncbi:MAG: DNA polymerase III subunit delta [Propionicimonas sp.]|uniref:DNA polymerase III subunit delta n=1 Tax=Propionicimonas sp. TaxID=1955623 RepID=UPI002B20FE08|nr:DNA polymerase III subunit delta [Propionicimonas sp.]MEA4945031.1 DNA polymerase III subunit delta [Propionicimonas sp.]
MESPFGSTLLVTGPESLFAERAVTDLVQAAIALRPDASVTRLSAAGLSLGGLAEATGGSLFADASVVVVTELPELPAEVADALVATAADPGPELALALVHPGGVKGKAVLDKLRKVAAREVECLAVKPWELPQFVVAETRRAGGRIDARTASVLIDAVGSDLRSLAAAVRQLLDDADAQAVTEPVIRRYFGGRAEVTSFAVADDVLSGNAEGALGKLRWALSTGVAPVLVTSALSSGLRNLGKYLDARDGRLRDADVAKLIGVPPWKLKGLAQQARAWQPAGVARAIRSLAVADAQIKGAASDPGFALEQVVLTVIGCRRS